MQRVKLTRSGRQMIYKMSAALIGDGFWGRDSRGRPDCCRWTGPGDDSVLYVPSFDEPIVEVAMDVRGWIAPEARADFRVKIWDEAVDHRFERAKSRGCRAVSRGAAPRRPEA